jgi:cytoskeletal protein CcmA (bactofilin family)
MGTWAKAMRKIPGKMGIHRWRIVILASIALISYVYYANHAWAAEIRGGEGGGEVFRLPAGEVIHDDLVVAAGEVIIDGTVEGDLVAAGGYIEVNGHVTGDVLLAGGGVVVNGRIDDDARIAGGGVTLAGSVGDDLFVAGGGPVWPGGPVMPFQVRGRNIAQGVQVASSATVGGDAYIAGGQGVIDGAVNGDLFAGMGQIVFGGRVGGDARLYGQTLRVRNEANVAGVLRYRSSDAMTPPPGVAASIEAETAQATEPADAGAPGRRLWSVVAWLWRTVLLAAGFALLAWLLWQLAPGFLESSGRAIAARPVEAALYGIVAAALLLPVAIVLGLLFGIFWGWAGAVAVALLILSVVTLLWLLSPLLAGYWLGDLLLARGHASSRLLALLAGVLLIVLVARLVAIVPCIGVLTASVIYLLSFVMALGGLILTRRQQAQVAMNHGNL